MSRWPFAVRMVAATGVAAVTSIAVTSMFRRSGPAPTKGPTLELDPWEAEALAAGFVGTDAHHHTPPDETAIGSGSPVDHCGPALGGKGDDDQPWACVADPLEDPRFAPIPRGAPMAIVPSSSRWPVITEDQRRLVTSYWTAEGVRGASGRAFGAKRRGRARRRTSWSRPRTGS